MAVISGEEVSSGNRILKSLSALRARIIEGGYAIRILSLLLTFAVWEWYGRRIDPIFFSYPSAIAAVFPDMIRSGELPKAAFLSLQSLVVGFSLSVIFGVGLGLLMGRYRAVYAALDTQITALYATPYVTLVPLIILWFGLGLKAKVVIVILASLFPIVINTRDGVRNVSRSLIDIARAEKATERQIFSKIIVPASVPSIMTGIRLGIGRAIVGMIVAEMFTAITGLGGSIEYYSNQFRTDKLLVVVIVLAIAATALTEAAKFAEARVAAWKRTERGGV